MATPYRRLPSVDRVLSQDRIKELLRAYSHKPVVDLVRQQLDQARLSIKAGGPAHSLDRIIEDVTGRARSMWRWWPRPVTNATGVILHTNLGRAPLSLDAQEAIMQSAKGYSSLELDLSEGKRGSRQEHVEPLLQQLTGAQAALVVNNNASGVLLGLTALARGREVIISRGEAVEVGGGFRIPEVLRQSGATLVEVGTTNRTYATDYANAISENTALLLKVHASNFRITGFTHSPALEELVKIGNRHKLPVLHDLGSGCLLDTTLFQLAHEPMPQESIAAGASLAFFSGDKMLGGPQAGIVIGKQELVDHLQRHPMARAMRIDKLSLAALTATLLHYIRGEATEHIPCWRMLCLSLDELEARAQAWRSQVGTRSKVVPGLSTVGGGSLPGETLRTWLLSIRADNLPGGVLGLAQRLRENDPPVISRIEADHVMLDPRTVMPDEEPALLRVVQEALQP